MKAEVIEVSLVIYGAGGDEPDTEGQLVLYRLSVTIGPGRDDVNVEQVIEELRPMLSKWATSWLRLGHSVKLEEP